jgi:hypothetical protein
MDNEDSETEHIIYEGDESIYDKLNDEDVVHGDKIHVLTNNQMGEKVYRVLSEDGEKKIVLIKDYDGDYMDQYKDAKKNKESLNIFAESIRLSPSSSRSGLRTNPERAVLDDILQGYTGVINVDTMHKYMAKGKRDKRDKKDKKYSKKLRRISRRKAIKKSRRKSIKS